MEKNAKRDGWGSRFSARNALLTDKLTQTVGLLALIFLLSSCGFPMFGLDVSHLQNRELNENGCNPSAD